MKNPTDDILGMPRTFNEAYSQLAQVLNCTQNGFIVSGKKFDIGTNITYGGFNLEKKQNETITIKADQTRIDTILNMEPPAKETQVQSFLGMIKVLHSWYPTMTIQTKHLRKITHENNHWNGNWSPELDNEFKQIKHSIAQNLQLNPYNPGRSGL